LSAGHVLGTTRIDNARQFKKYREEKTFNWKPYVYAGGITLTAYLQLVQFFILFLNLLLNLELQQVQFTAFKILKFSDSNKGMSFKLTKEINN
jgi:hypothetical protein